MKRIVGGADVPGINPVLLYKEELTHPQPIAEAAARSTAYEMAVCVCDADDALI